MPTFSEAFYEAFRKAKETNPDLTRDEFARMAWDAKSKKWRFAWNDEVPPPLHKKCLRMQRVL
jgi:hypothetical protein